MASATKYGDYEAAGVREYWLIDPAKDRVTFYRLTGERFVEAPTSGDTYTSEVVPGFLLDVSKVRAAFQRLSRP